MRKKLPSVFVSHAASESAVVNTFVGYLRIALPDVRFYVSSSYQYLKPGASWWDDIRSTLSQAQIILACISRQSIDKPWILFESGVGIGCGAVVIPVILDDLPYSHINPPLSMYQAVRMNKNGASSLVESIANITKAKAYTERLQRKPIPKFSELTVSVGMLPGIYRGTKRNELGGWQRYLGNPNNYREDKDYISIGNSSDDGFRYPPSDSLKSPFHYWGFRIKRTQGVHMYAAVKCANGLTYIVYVSSEANMWGFISHPTNEFVVPASSIPRDRWQAVIVNVSSIEKKFDSPIQAITGFRARGPLMLSHIWCVDNLVQIPKVFVNNAIQLVYPGET